MVGAATDPRLKIIALRKRLTYLIVSVIPLAAIIFLIYFIGLVLSIQC
jgi:hypothetical protein